MQLKRASLLCVAALCASARADDSFTAKTQVYTDSDHTTVVSPLAAISRDAWRGGTVSASYVADVVSSASVDVVSNATSQMHDFRSEITAGLTQKLANWTLNGSYIYSVENDYQSHNGNLGLSVDLFDKNSTLALGYVFSVNDIFRTGDQQFHRRLLVNGASAAWTQVFDRKTVGQLSYTFAYNDGYQASPYRFVRIETPDLTGIVFKVPETEPQQRYRHAAVMALNRYLFPDSTLQGDYRFYVDNWGVQAHTLQLRWFITFHDVTLRLRERLYYQTAASFYQPHYQVATLQSYVTSDRELSNLWSNLVGVKLSWRLPWVHRALELEVKADYFHYGYLNFPLLAARDGANLEAGLNVIY